MYTVKHLMRDLRAGKFTSIGSYPTYFVTLDGEALSHEAVRENLWQIARATRDYPKTKAPDLCQWAILGCDINYEDPDLHGNNLPHLVRTSIEYTCENGHCAEWTCECGQVNDITADLHTYRINNLR